MRALNFIVILIIFLMIFFSENSYLQPEKKSNYAPSLTHSEIEFEIFGSNGSHGIIFDYSEKNGSSIYCGATDVGREINGIELDITSHAAFVATRKYDGTKSVFTYNVSYQTTTFGYGNRIDHCELDDQGGFHAIFEHHTQGTGVGTFATTNITIYNGWYYFHQSSDGSVDIVKKINSIYGEIPQVFWGERSLIYTGIHISDITLGNFTSTGTGWPKGFIAELNYDGTREWAKNAGPGIYKFNGLDVSGNNVYVAGSLCDESSGDSRCCLYFDGTELCHNYGQDGFIAKLNKSAKSWEWVQLVGGSGAVELKTIKFDSSDSNLYFGGLFGRDLEVDYFSLSSEGKFDMLIGSSDMNGNFRWFSSGGGSQRDEIWDLLIWNNSLIMSGIECKELTNTPSNCQSKIGNQTFNHTNTVGKIFIAGMTKTGMWIFSHRIGGDGDHAVKNAGYSLDYSNIGNSSIILSGTVTSNPSIDGISYTQLESGFIWKLASGPEVFLDFDGDGIDDADDNCPRNYNAGQLDFDSDFLGDECDFDDDGDGVLDLDDSCPYGLVNVTSVNANDHDRDGCLNGDEDDDDDGDGILDVNDNCLYSVDFFISSVGNDWDSDGCSDYQEDSDDDNDGVVDSLDDCSRGGEHSWSSDNLTDHDSDGCMDSSEDSDDDNDGKIDLADNCPKGIIGWFSHSAIDFDRDGCLDESEDLDDDDDGIIDLEDNCPKGSNNWISTMEDDSDSDGCEDSIDDDIDGDGIGNPDDDCPDGISGWISNQSSDHDSDGCRDQDEDDDDDNDGLTDERDSCPSGLLNWNYLEDLDRDGCENQSEDFDDDSDGVEDDLDLCPEGLTNWRSDSTTDIDSDGCNDEYEDEDDDNDSILDETDLCPRGHTQWISSTMTDHDSDGCEDETEDLDDDSDTVLDNSDDCPRGILDWISSEVLDYDGDGCKDVEEDQDDDGDGISDVSDNCPLGEMYWLSTQLTDYDGDGCLDSFEDADDDNDGILDEKDRCKSEIGWTSSLENDADSDGCVDINKQTSLLFPLISATILISISVLIAHRLEIIDVRKIRLEKSQTEPQLPSVKSSEEREIANPQRDNPPPKPPGLD